MLRNLIFFYDDVLYRRCKVCQPDIILPFQSVSAPHSCVRLSLVYGCLRAFHQLEPSLLFSALVSTPGQASQS